MRKNPVKPIVDLITKLSRKVGEVPNLHGNVFEPVVIDSSPQRGGWYLVYGSGTIPRDIVIDAHESALSPAPVTRSDDGVITLTTAADETRNLMLYTGFTPDVPPEAPGTTVPISVTVNKQVEVRLYVNDSLFVNRFGSFSTDIPAVKGKNQIQIIVVRPDEVEVTVETPSYLRVGEIPNGPAAPLWEAPALTYNYYGTHHNAYGFKLQWQDDAFVGAWEIHRADYTSVGAINSVTDNADGSYTINVDGLHTQVGQDVIIDGTWIGTIQESLQNVSDTDFTVISSVAIGAWTGETMYVSSAYGLVSTVQRINSLVPTDGVQNFIDYTVRESLPYTYRLAATHPLHPEAKSALSDRETAMAVDSTVPGDVTAVTATTYSDRVVVDYTAPTDLDYAGTQVYYQNGAVYTLVLTDWGQPGASDQLSFFAESSGTYWLRTFDVKGNIQAEGDGVSFTATVSNETYPFGGIAASVDDAGQVSFTFWGNSHAASFAYKVSESGYSGSSAGATVVNSTADTVVIPTGTIQLAEGQICYIEGWFYGSANGTGLEGPTVREQIGLTSIIYPTVAESASESGTTGTLSLTVHDPQTRVTEVAFKSKSGNSAWPGSWTVDTSPYSANVTLVEDHSSHIAYRVTFNDSTAASRTIEGVVAFDIDDVATVGTPTIAFDASDNVVISASGDSDTANIYVTAQVGSAPADPTNSVNNGTIAGRSGSVPTTVVCRRGQTVYVKVRGYNSGASAGPVRSAEVTRTYWYTPSIQEVASETSHTNLVTDSENFGVWGSVNSPTLTSGQTDPLGGTSAYLLEDDSASQELVRQNVASFTGDGEKFVSVFLKAGTAGVTDVALQDSTVSTMRHHIRATWSGGVPALTTVAGAGTRYPVEDWGSGWYRIKFSATGVVAANNNRVVIYPAGSPAANTGTVYAFGAQAENGTSVTAYLRTSGSSLTSGLGTITLTVADPLTRVTQVAFSTQSGNGTASPYVALSSPYTASVNLTEAHPSKIAYRIRFTDENNTSRDIIQVVTFDTDTTATVTGLGATFSSTDDVIVSSSGDSDTSNIYVTAQVGSAPSDPTSTVNNGTIAGRTGSVSTGVTCRRGQTVYLKARAYNSAGVAGPVMSSQMAHGFWYTPSVQETVTEAGGLGTLSLTVTDPQSRVTQVAFATQSGPGAMSGFVADSAPYAVSVALHEDHISKIAYRVRFTDENGASRDIINVVAFDADSDATITSPGIQFGTDGTVTVGASGDSDTANIFFRITTDGTEPTDPTNASYDATVAGRTGSVVSAKVCALGGTTKVRARGYNSASAGGPVTTAQAVRDQGAHQSPKAFIGLVSETATQATVEYEGELGTGTAPLQYSRAIFTYNGFIDLTSGWSSYAGLGTGIQETITRDPKYKKGIAMRVKDAEGNTSSPVFFSIDPQMDSIATDGYLDPDKKYSGMNLMTPRHAGKQGHGVFLEDFEDGVNGWTLRTGAGAVSTVSGEGQAGGKIVRVTGGRAWYTWNTNCAFDPSKLYRIRARVRCSLKEVGVAETVFLGVMGVAADGTTLVSTAGTNVYTSAHWAASNGYDLDAVTEDVWVEFTGYFKGWSATPTNPSSSLTSHSPLTPMALHTNVRYFRPVFVLLPTAATTAVVDIDEFAIDILDEDGTSRVYTGFTGTGRLQSGVESTADIDGTNAGQVRDDALTGREWVSGSSNYVYNGGGQVDDVGASPPTGWTSGSNGTQFDVVNDQFKFGDRSINMTPNSALNCRIYQEFTTASGDVWELSGWVKTSALVLGTGVGAGLSLLTRLAGATGGSLEKLETQGLIAQDADEVHVGLGAGTTDWTFVRALVRVSGADSIRVYVNSINGTVSGDAWFDGVSFIKMAPEFVVGSYVGRRAAGSPSDNYITNGGGQENLNGESATGWTFNAGNALVVTNEQYKNGDRCLTIANSVAADSYSSQSFSVSAGDIFELAGWIMTPSGLSGAGRGAVLHAVMNGGTGMDVLEAHGLVGTVGTADFTVGRAVGDSTTGWEYYRAVFRAAQTDTLYIYAQLGAYGTVGGTAYYDGIVFRRLPDDTYARVHDTIDSSGNLSPSTRQDGKKLARGWWEPSAGTLIQNGGSVVYPAGYFTEVPIPLLGGGISYEPRDAVLSTDPGFYPTISTTLPQYRRLKAINRDEEGCDVVAVLYQKTATYNTHEADSSAGSGWPLNAVSEDVQSPDLSTFTNTPTIGNSTDEYTVNYTYELITGVDSSKPWIIYDIEVVLKLQIWTGASWTTLGTKTYYAASEGGSSTILNGDDSIVGNYDGAAATDNLRLLVDSVSTSGGGNSFEITARTGYDFSYQTLTGTENVASMTPDSTDTLTLEVFETMT